jgi:hypothetical protein
MLWRAEVPSSNMYALFASEELFPNTAFTLANASSNDVG